MGAGTPNDIMFVPGKLCKDPTDLTIAFPHGGTALGNAQGVILRTNIEYPEIMAEEFGGEHTDYVITGERVILAGVIRGLDNDMLQQLFLNTSAGSSSGDRIIEYPGTNRAGKLGHTKAFKLVLSPTQSQDSNPFLILYHAVPMINGASDINHGLSVEYGFGFMFRGIRDSSNQVYAIGKREDLTL